MKRSTIFGTALAFFIAASGAVPGAVPEIPPGNDPGWGVEHDSRAGSTLYYRTRAGHDLLRIDCVGPSIAMPLMDMTRPFNTIISAQTSLARDWLTGREVFAMLLAVEGWRRVDVLAIHDRLIIGPKETERAMIAMQLTGRLKLKIIGNTQRGVVEEDIDVSSAGVYDPQSDQIAACRKHFVK